MYETVFSPGRIGSLSLENRLVVPAMTSLLSDPDGVPTEEMMAYYARKAMGGWGLIITENIRVAPHGGASVRLPGLWEDRQIPGHRALVRRVHDAGGKLCAQIYHAGPQASRAVSGVQPTAPSALCLSGYSEVPRELTEEEIRVLVADFASAARRAVEAGYDAIELHGAHGYLIGRFLSGRSNKRTDRYGGTLEGRNQFLREILTAVRAEIGPAFPLLLRLSASEYIEGGITPAETAVTAMMAEKLGADAIHCSAGTVETNYRIIPPSAVAPGAYADNAAGIKACVDVPVIAVGRVNDPLTAEQILRSGKADFVSMGRASLADPDLPAKARAGRADQINRCIGCVQGCIGENKKGRHCTCLVNPTAGYETELTVTPAERPLKVTVVGGGVAGAETAIVAAMRGHRVELFEASDRLGGQWIAASIPPGKADFAAFLKWQAYMLERLGVTVHLNCRASAEDILAGQPHRIVLATGGADVRPPIRGIDCAVPAEQILRGRVRPGARVAVIGGGLVGAETAAYLAREGRAVTVLERLPEIAGDGEPNVRHYLMEDLERYRTAVYTCAEVKSVDQGQVCFVHGGEEHRLETDTVVLAAGLRPASGLWEALQDCGTPVVRVGNAAEVKNGFWNIREGFQTGREL